MVMKIKKYLLLSICMLLSIMLISSGADAAQKSASDEVKKGIVRLCIGYTKNDEAGAEFYQISQTCGCLVSNFSNSVYIVAPYHDMNISEKKKKKFLKKNKLKKDNVTLVRKVFISDDMKSDVEIVTTSEQNDFCLLSVEDVIKEKVSLRFKKNDSIDEAGKVKAAGYSKAAKKEGHFDDNDIQFSEGKIINKSKKKDGAEYIEHTAEISSENSGGALIDKTGYFIGMNNKKYNKAGKYYSLKTDKIKELLDNRGIEYYSEENDIAVSELKKELQKCVKLIADSEYKTASKDSLNQAVEKVNESLNSEENISIADAKNLKNELIVQKKKLVKKTSKIFVMQVVVGIIDAVFVIWLISLIVKNKKSAKELKQIEEENKNSERNKEQEVRNSDSGGENQKEMDEKYIDDIGATVKMVEYTGQKNTFENRKYIAYLKRNKNNSYAMIDREKFIIGKNKDTVNYLISDNKTISRVHAGIQWVDEQYLLYDMGSVNGTYVNNIKLIDKPVKLNNGDIILLSNEYFQFLITTNK